MGITTAEPINYDFSLDRTVDLTPTVHFFNEEDGRLDSSTRRFSFSKPSGRPICMQAQLKKLQELATLKFDWEEAGAVPISPDAIRKAQRFLKKIRSHLTTTATQSLVSPTVAPSADGHVHINWRSESGGLLAEFFPDRVEYYVELVNGTTDASKGCHRNMENLANALLPWIVKFARIARGNDRPACRG